MKTYSKSVREFKSEPVIFGQGHSVSYLDDSLVVICSGVINKFSDGGNNDGEEETFEGMVIDSKIDHYCVGQIIEEFPQGDFVNFFGRTTRYSEMELQPKEDENK